MLLGYSPEFLAAANWVIASVVAGFAAIIVGPFGGSLSPVQLTSLLGFFLAAMLIAKLSSTMMATFGGLGLGMIFTWSGSWLVAQDWFPLWIRTGVKEAIPLVAIVIVLFITGKQLPVRGTVEEKRLPLAPYPKRMVPHTIIWSAVVIVIAYIGRDVFDGIIPFALQTGLITAILMLSYVILTGYVGQISLAQLGLAGVAAFFMARMMADDTATSINPFPVSGPALNWPIAMILGIAVAVAVGMILAIPALRIRGVQLAVVTIAAAIALQTLYLENDQLTGLRAGAPAEVKRPSLFGIDLGSTGDGGLTNNPPFTIFCLVLLVAACWFVANIRRIGHRPPVPVRAGQRAGRGGRRRQRAPHQDAGLRHQRRAGRHGRHDATGSSSTTSRRPASSSASGCPCWPSPTSPASPASTAPSSAACWSRPRSSPPSASTCSRAWRSTTTPPSSAAWA